LVCSRFVPSSVLKTAGVIYRLLEKKLQLRDTPLMSIAAIRDEILGLPPEERAKLIDLIWNSLSEPKTKSCEMAWTAESERRVDAFEAGKLVARDGNEILSELKNSERK
jgi:putative addiction module component (TIGR02574 family)